MPMKPFSTELDQKLERLLDQSGEAFDNGESEQSLRYLIEAYQSIPSPRVEYTEAFNYCSYVLLYILDEGAELDTADEWLEELQVIADEQGVWEGQIDFYAGKTHFKLGREEQAMQSFEQCVSIGRGYRYFADEPDCLAFFKSKRKSS